MKVMVFLVEKLGNQILLARDEEGWTSAHSAARAGDLTMLKYIVETAGVSPLMILAGQGAGPTAMDIATEHGHTEAFEYLKAVAEQKDAVTGN